MSPAELVRSFYDDVWNRADTAAAKRILAPDLSFRGSLGPEHRGRDGFLDYLRSVHAALTGFRCIIHTLVVEDEMAAARMRFEGTHTGPLLGAAPTGRPVAWSGAAFFRCAAGQIADIWVLGDIDGLRAQLGPG